ncbi:ATP-binding protein [Nonomuraea thailandensis]
MARLDDRFRLLASGQRGAPARQQTLTAVIDWSWDLLQEEERVVLRRLAVHVDGCTLEAAESVCDGADHLDVLDLLARLVDRSLVVVVDAPTGVRYRLLESVSEYCRARMSDAGELDAVHQAHLRHYLDLAVRAEPALHGPEQRDWLLRLDAEAANMRAALDTAAARGDAYGAARLVNALAWYWFLRGRLAEGRRAMAQALAVPGQDAGPVRARAAAWEAGFALCLGEQPDWRPVLDAVEDPGSAPGPGSSSGCTWTTCRPGRSRRSWRWPRSGRSATGGASPPRSPGRPWTRSRCATMRRSSGSRGRAPACSPSWATGGGCCAPPSGWPRWPRCGATPSRRTGCSARGCGWPRSWGCGPRSPRTPPGWAGWRWRAPSTIAPSSCAAAR